MSIEKFIKTPLKIDGACTYKLIETPVEGGSEIELFNILKSHPCPSMPQITVSRSCKNVIRGLHCSPHHKMVCCPTGKAFDVVVDLRPNSPTFLKWDGAWLDRTTHIVIPPYCAHGFFAAEDGTAILYLQGGCFAPALDFSVKWDDPRIGVAWPKPIDSDDYVISPKDRNNPLFSEEVHANPILERIQHPIEALKLGPYADFAIIADQPSPAIQNLIEVIQSKEKKWHFCGSNGDARETLQEELYALKPFIGVIYIASSTTPSDLLANFTRIMNIVSASDHYKFPLTILIDDTDFAGKTKALELIKSSCPSVTVRNIPANSDDYQSFISSLIQ